MKCFQGTATYINLFNEETWAEQSKGTHACIQFMDIYGLSKCAQHDSRWQFHSGEQEHKFPILWSL